MDRHDPCGEVLVRAALEAGGGHHALELVLRRMLADGLGEVLVAVAVVGEQLAEARQDLERVEVVDRLEPVGSDFGELQHAGLAADLEHAVHLAQRGVLVGDVAQAEGDGDQIETGIRERQLLGVALHVLEAADVAAVGVAGSIRSAKAAVSVLA